MCTLSVQKRVQEKINNNLRPMLLIVALIDEAPPLNGYLLSSDLELRQMLLLHASSLHSTLDKRQFNLQKRSWNISSLGMVSSDDCIQLVFVFHVIITFSIPVQNVVRSTRKTRFQRTTSVSVERPGTLRTSLGAFRIRVARPAASFFSRNVDTPVFYFVTLDPVLPVQRWYPPNVTARS